MMADVEKSGSRSGAGILGDISAHDAKELMEQTRVAVDEAVEEASRFIRARPILCLAGALALGYVIGKIVSR
jgi:hypothetical protein